MYKFDATMVLLSKFTLTSESGSEVMLMVRVSLQPPFWMLAVYDDRVILAVGVGVIARVMVGLFVTT